MKITSGFSGFKVEPVSCIDSKSVEDFEPANTYFRTNTVETLKICKAIKPRRDIFNTRSYNEMFVAKS
jgi:hypothetical protein